MAKAAQVVVAGGPPVTVVPVSRQAASGTINVGDVLDVVFYSGGRAGEAVRNQNLINLESMIAQRTAELQTLLRTYRPDFPDAVAKKDEIRALQARRDQMINAEGIGQNQTLLSLRNQANTLKSEIAAAELILQNKTGQAVQAQKDLREAQDRVATGQDLQRNRMEVQAKTTALNTLQDQINAEKSRQALLEANLTNIIADESKLIAVPRPDRRVELHVTVRQDGRISVSPAGDIAAAGLTTDQLQDALDRRLGMVQPQSQVQIEQPAGPSITARKLTDQSTWVTFTVPLESSQGEFHVFGEVTTSSKKIVASFDEAVHDKPASAKELALRPGTYHLIVVARNMATGRIQTSALDFTVD